MWSFSDSYFYFVYQKMSGCSKKTHYFCCSIYFHPLSEHCLFKGPVHPDWSALTGSRKAPPTHRCLDGSFKRHRFSMWAVYMLTLHSIYLKHLELLYNAKIFYFCHLEFIQFSYQAAGDCSVIFFINQLISLILFEVFDAFQQTHFQFLVLT